MNFVVRVRKECAERERLLLIDKDIFDFSRRVKKEGDYVLLPVKRYLTEYECFEDLSPIYNDRTSPVREIERRCGIKIRGWRRFGKVAIFRSREIDEEVLRSNAKVISEILGVKCILLEDGVEGEYREPRIKVIYGFCGDVRYVENGIVYTFDPTKIMFCAGNVGERYRMSRIDMEDEVVVDMFAGVGYFSLPIAKYCKPRRVYACEKNAIAFKYLCNNIKINDLEDKVIPIYGDNREVAPERVADRIVMGYIRTEDFLVKAFRVLKEVGGIIHYHNVYHKSVYKDRALRDIEMHARINNFRLDKWYIRKIKSYSPNLVHFVLDAYLVGT